MQGGSATPSRAGSQPTPDAITLAGSAVEGDDPLAGLATVVGRFVVVDRIGQGGMGNVLRAYDTKLYRNVALKLLRVGDDAEARSRIVREARAMARLSHPNIVPVFDVGEHEGAPFIAMEFVDGVDLRQWVAAESRPWRAIVRVFLDAGRGLAAAHSAGLVHRDFKPDNVLLGDDGRVRVTDFGLARGLHAAERVGAGGSIAPATSLLTMAGTVMGTLAYMAPEQHSGERVDERSDQYAYCVSLWEAAYGRRPFEGDDLVLAKAKLRFSATDPVRVPRFLRRILMRGLAPHPDDRWPSMDELLVALERRPPLRRMVALGCVGILALGAAWWGRDRWQRAEAQQACESEAAAIDGVWGEEARARVHRQFAAADVPYALPTFERLVPWLDRHAAALREHELDVCLAAAGLVEPRPHPGSAPCLAERRAQLAAQVDVLVTADAAIVRRAVASAASLPSPSTCVDADWLARWRPESTQPESPAGAEVQAQLLAVESLLGAGRFEDAAAAAGDTLAAAEAIDDERLIVRARELVGRAAQDRGDYDTAELELERAFAAATSAGLDARALETANMLAYVVGDAKAKHEAGLVWGQVAWAIAKRIGADEDPVAADLHNTIGGVHQNAGAKEKALASYRDALAVAERTVGLEHPLAARSQTNIATTLQELGRYDESLAAFEVAISTYESVLGPESPELSVPLNNYGNALNSAGRWREALRAFERATELFERAGVEDVRLAPMLYNTGNAHAHMGNGDEALDYYLRAHAIWDEAVDEDHPYIALGLSALSVTYGARGDLDRAIEYEEQALAIRKRAHGSEHPEVATSLNNLGGSYAERGDWDRGQAACEEARDIWTRTLGPTHPDVAFAMLNLGSIELSRGDVEAAQRTVAHAADLLVAAFGEEHERSALAFQNLGDVLLAGGDVDGALKSLERARAVLERIGYSTTGLRMAMLWSALGRARLESGDLDGAVQSFERGRVAAVGLPDPSRVRAELDFGTARTSWAQGQHRLALELAQRAAESFAALGPTGASRRAAIDAWLADHG